jgi:hypothetical protein
MRHDPGLAASPPVRYKLKVARGFNLLALCFSDARDAGRSTTAVLIETEIHISERTVVSLATGACEDSVIVYAHLV